MITVKWTLYHSPSSGAEGRNHEAITPSVSATATERERFLTEIRQQMVTKLFKHSITRRESAG